MTVSIRTHQWGGYDNLMRLLKRNPKIKHHFTPKKQWLVFETIPDYDLWNKVHVPEEE